ncbi:MAG: YncE family protein [Gemmatimonadota bacterium]|nr:YncE family protein [Gemmatimonadota bacterium]
MPAFAIRRTLRAAASLVALLPSALLAQQFKVEKANIGGEGGTDYVSVDNTTGRVYVSRATHVMVVDGATMKVVCDIPDTPRMHGVGISQKAGRGFTTNAGDSTVTVFALKDCSFIRKIKVASGGLDGIMYDAADDRIVLTNHSRPTGTVTVIDPNAMEVVGTVELEDIAPEGAAADGNGHLFVNNEGKSTIQVVDLKTMKTTASWPLAPCEGPTGIAYDKATNRIFSGCSNTSVVVDASSGKVVAQIANGAGVDALGWDAAKKLIYIPAGRAGNVTVVHQDSPDKYSVVATVETVPGAKTICVDDKTHAVYLFQPEYGPAPAPDPNAPPPAAGRGGRGGPRGPMVAAWFIKITQ